MVNVRYELPPLPYSFDALEPIISSEIMKLHHDKHHQAYVNGANAALETLEKARKGEVEINYRSVLKDLSFHLNGHLLHEIFWTNMKAYEKMNKVPKELELMINKNFGSFEMFTKEFSEVSKQLEGSGWVMLVRDDKSNLLITQVQSHNMLGIGCLKPVLVNDLWEHAYYLGYQNDRAKYIENWWSVVNWENVLLRINS
ncbi:MAG: Superoxide dismutase [candidate division WS6 bacterium GW2011_GWF2_39_15]|uniref:Superoxide dismutase n=1 Tax=candidate division WS6 bacterium GW2011_GWF2_39_15 TaxID=1619100 RepID=A0A0G0QWV5_9BACT|nr:MAG: Superoxide dismutase [candidate division WS6 bacterium GW2011_GWF2_39_15]